MTSGRARVALCAALVACAAGAVAPSQASALFSNYSCAAKAPAQWCDGRANGSFDGLHSWNYNRGYLASGWTTLCEHIWQPANGFEYPNGCAIGNSVSHYYGDVGCACYEAEVKHYYTSALNIYGQADTEVILP